MYMWYFAANLHTQTGQSSAEANLNLDGLWIALGVLSVIGLVIVVVLIIIRKRKAGRKSKSQWHPTSSFHSTRHEKMSDYFKEC